MSRNFHLRITNCRLKKPCNFRNAFAPQPPNVPVNFTRHKLLKLPIQRGKHNSHPLCPRQPYTTAMNNPYPALSSSHSYSFVAHLVSIQFFFCSCNTVASVGCERQKKIRCFFGKRQEKIKSLFGHSHHRIILS